MCGYVRLYSAYHVLLLTFRSFSGTADIFRGIMVSLYVKGKENGHVQVYAPTGGNEA